MHLKWDSTEYLKRIWSTRWLTNNGEVVQLLERKLEEYLKIKNLVLVSNGTLALQLALKALDLKGEVITRKLARKPTCFSCGMNCVKLFKVRQLVCFCRHYGLSGGSWLG